MSNTDRAKAIRDAREILLAARAAGGSGLKNVWLYLRDELDACEVSR